MYTTTTALFKPTGQQKSGLRFTKRIGSAVYEVNIGFNPNAKETMDDIILRLIKNEAESGRLAG